MASTAAAAISAEVFAVSLLIDITLSLSDGTCFVNRTWRKVRARRWPGGESGTQECVQSDGRIAVTGDRPGV